MYNRNIIGDKHTPKENILRSLKSKNVNKAYKELVAWGFIIQYNTGHGIDIKLNKLKLKEIKEILLYS